VYSESGRLPATRLAYDRAVGERPALEGHMHRWIPAAMLAFCLAVPAAAQTPSDVPYLILSTFIPARAADVVINGKRAAGNPTPRMRGTRHSSSAFLAVAETWLK
jgi:hypothetical protein